MIKRIAVISSCLLAISMAVFLTGNICFAKVPLDRVAIGGITPGVSAEYVRKIYGAPDKINSKGNSALYTVPTEEYIYGDSLFITIMNGKVHHVVVTKNNGLGTPDGVTVGMDSSVLTDIYGKADRVFNNRNYVYNFETSHELLFKTQNGKIISIGAGSFD